LPYAPVVASRGQRLTRQPTVPGAYISSVTYGPARLRKWSPADGTRYVAQLSDPDIQRFTTEQPATTADDFRSAVELLSHRPDQAGFAIVDVMPGELAGNIAAGDWPAQPLACTTVESVASCRSRPVVVRAGSSHRGGLDDRPSGASCPLRGRQGEQARSNMVTYGQVRFATEPQREWSRQRGAMRAHRCGKSPDTMRSVEMRKCRSEPLPNTRRRAGDALPYSTLD
jgi:hypothetical protein